MVIPPVVLLLVEIPALRRPSCARLHSVGRFGASWSLEWLPSIILSSHSQSILPVMCWLLAAYRALAIRCETATFVDCIEYWSACGNMMIWLLSYMQCSLCDVNQRSLVCNCSKSLESVSQTWLRKQLNWVRLVWNEKWNKMVKGPFRSIMVMFSIGTK